MFYGWIVTDFLNSLSAEGYYVNATNRVSLAPKMCHFALLPLIDKHTPQNPFSFIETCTMELGTPHAAKRSSSRVMKLHHGYCCAKSPKSVFIAFSYL